MADRLREADGTHQDYGRQASPERVVGGRIRLAEVTPERANRPAVRENQGTMTYWFVVIVPLVIMLFALFMERVEARLKNLAIREHDVEEFLEQARPEEVRALYGHGIGRALELFRRRRLGGRSGRSPQRRVRARV